MTVHENKKLSYRRRTVQRTMLVNLCYISRAMAVIKVPNSESDLQGHSRALTVVPFDRPHTISYYSSTATMSLSCTVSEILSLFPLNLKRSRDSEHIPFECLHACACVCEHILTSLQVPVLVKMQINKLAKSTAVIVHHGPCISKRLQQWIHLHDGTFYEYQVGTCSAMAV